MPLVYAYVVKRKRKYGSGTVYETTITRRDGSTRKSYRARVTLPDPFGPSGRKTLYKRFSLKKDAEAWLELIANQSDSDVKNDPDTKVSSYCLKWMVKQAPKRAWNPNTRKHRIGLIKNPIIPSLGEATFREFPDAIGEWLDRLHQSRSLKYVINEEGEKEFPVLSAACIQQSFILFRGILDDAVKDGYLPSNPLQGVKQPKAPPVPVPYFTAHEVDNILLPALKGEPIQALVQFVAYTGVRRGEALALKWSSVDFDRSLATISESNDQKSTKTSRIRVVALPTFLHENLWELRRVNVAREAETPNWNKGDYVFITSEGTPIDGSNAGRSLRRILKNVGLSTRRPFYSLRHGYASRLIQRGMEGAKIQQRLGHASIRTTIDIYAHLADVPDVLEDEQYLGIDRRVADNGSRYSNETLAWRRTVEQWHEILVQRTGMLWVIDYNDPQDCFPDYIDPLDPRFPEYFEWRTGCTYQKDEWLDQPLSPEPTGVD